MYKSQKSEIGNKPPPLDPQTLRSDHRSMCERPNALKHLQLFRTSGTATANISFSPLKTLHRIAIKDLCTNAQAKGHYLLLRILEPLLHVGFAASTIVEDHLGDLSNFVIFNYFEYDSKITPAELMPIGTVFILKEPFLKHDTNVRIYCECPTDLVLVDRNHFLYHTTTTVIWKNSVSKLYSDIKVPSTPLEWKEIGNKLYQNKCYLGAIEAYLMSLKTCSDQNMRLILHNNLSAAYFALEYFESALENALKALDLTETNEKALYRAGRAHYQLRQFLQARDCFKELVTLYPKNAEGSLELKRCNERLKEEIGVINIYKMNITSIVRPSTLLDCADYVGELEVVEIPGKGRGIVATQNIDPGSLLIVSKAFQAVFQETSGIGSRYSCDLEDNYNKLTLQIARSVMKNPNCFGNLVYNLSTNDPTLDDGFQLFCEEGSSSEPIADIERIRKIIATNVFDLSIWNDHPDKSSGSFGLFILPSFLNHSCLYNATWRSYNDVMIVQSIKYIKQGEEITTSYATLEDGFLSRREKLQKRGFECACILCVQDKGVPEHVHEKREALEADFQQLISQKYEERQIIRFVNNFKQTYKDRENLRVFLFVPYFKLAEILDVDIDSYKEQFFIVIEKAYNCLGLSCRDLLSPSINLPINALISERYIRSGVNLIIYRLHETGYIDEARRWVKVLVALEHIFTGGDIRMVINRYRANRYGNNSYRTIVSLLENIQG